jgi:hypothetical protein
MAEKLRCEFYLVRYEPNIVTGNRVAVGVILVEQGPPETAFVGVRFRKDWAAVRAIDPNFEPDIMEALEVDLEMQLGSWAPEVINYRDNYSRRQWVLSSMQSAWSGALRMSDAVAILTESPSQELAVLAGVYLYAASSERSILGGRTFVYSGMKQAFEGAGVWHTPYMRKRIAPELFIRTGDPLRIDCGYRPNGTLRLFHATSLRNGVDTAKALALSFPTFEMMLTKAEGSDCRLTAVVEDDYDRDDPAVLFALDTFRKRDIDVAQLRDMPAIAERARIELKL